VIAAVVLAAGLSRRMGRPKLLLDLGGAAVVRRTVERVLAAGLDEILVVVPPDAAGITAALDGLAIRYAINPDPSVGQASSLVAGIRALDTRVTAALIALGDQPTVPVEVIPALVRAMTDTGRPIAAPVYAGERGNPVLFAAALFPELCAIAGDRGARGVVERDPARVALVPFHYAMPPDLDTPEDYVRLKPV
jgi:molybdenum cofactor cytidylyltransferase